MNNSYYIWPYIYSRYTAFLPSPICSSDCRYLSCQYPFSSINCLPGLILANTPKIFFLYILQPLRRALTRMGAPNLVPDNMDNSLSYSVITYLKKLKNQVCMNKSILGLKYYIVYNHSLLVRPLHSFINRLEVYWQRIKSEINILSVIVV